MTTKRARHKDPRRGREGKLVSKPVMIYPPSPDVRCEMALLAALDGSSLSRWMFDIAQKELERRSHEYRNWDKMVSAFRKNEVAGIRGMIGVPSPVEA